MGDLTAQLLPDSSQSKNSGLPKNSVQNFESSGNISTSRTNISSSPRCWATVNSSLYPCMRFSSVISKYSAHATSLSRKHCCACFTNLSNGPYVMTASAVITPAPPTPTKTEPAMATAPVPAVSTVAATATTTVPATVAIFTPFCKRVADLESGKMHRSLSSSQMISWHMGHDTSFCAFSSSHIASPRATQCFPSNVPSAFMHIIACSAALAYFFQASFTSSNT